MNPSTLGRSVRTLFRWEVPSPLPPSQWTLSLTLWPNPRSPVFQVRSLTIFLAGACKNLVRQGGSPQRANLRVIWNHSAQAIHFAVEATRFAIEAVQYSIEAIQFAIEAM